MVIAFLFSRAQLALQYLICQSGVTGDCGDSQNGGGLMRLPQALWSAGKLSATFAVIGSHSPPSSSRVHSTLWPLALSLPRSGWSRYV